MGFEDLARDDESLSDVGEHISCETYTIDQIVDKNKKHNFSLFQTNIRSLIKHHTELDSLLSTTNHSFDIVGCSETWLNENSHLDSLNIGGYNLMVKNRTYSVGGGVCLYVKSKYCVNVCENLTVNDGYSDSLFIEMNTIYAKKRIVGIIYRPPGFNPDIFRLKLEETLYHINNKNRDCIILGDFNIDISKDDTIKNDFINTLHSFSFFPTINIFTRVTNRSRTIIDNFITNIENASIDSGVILSEISDHLRIVLFMHLSNKFKLFLHKEKAKVLNLKTLTNLRENMLNKTWDHIYSCRDPDTA